MADQEKLHSVGANMGTLMMAVGSVAAANEAAKAIGSKDHTVKHGLQAGLGAAAATIGYEIAKNSTEPDTTNTKDDDKPPKPQRTRSVSSSSSSASSTRHRHHHKIHLAEEVVAAWAIVKKALGDKDHKATHLVEELLGLVGLYGEAKD